MTPSKASTSLHRNLLALAVVAAFCAAAVPIAGATTSATPYATVASPAQIRNGDVVLGPVPMNQPIHVVMALKLRDKQALDAFVEQAANDQRLGLAPHLMTSEEFLASHAPTRTQAQAVADFLTSHGFRNVIVAPNRMLVTADGTALTASDAFITRIAQVRMHNGRIAYANTDYVRIPASLSDTVIAAVGLQNVHRPQTSAATSVHTMSTFVHDPNEWQMLYGGNTTATAANVPVGMITYGSLTQTRTDIENWILLEGYPDDTVTQTINTGTPTTDTSGTMQWDLDSEDIVGMSGGQVRKLMFFNMPEFTDSWLTADINTAVSGNATKIINVSLGVCETDAKADGSAAAQDAILQVAVAQGQTFAVATGDTGDDECPSDGLSTPIPSWPAASQYVVAVAGTTLSATLPADVWAGETVWSKSGGSSSTFEPKPGWQSSFSQIINGVTYTVPGTTRAVADVAFDANPSSGASFWYGSGLYTAGGTGLAVSLFTGVWAQVLQLHPGIGFAGPVIYALPASAFHDVVSGSNGISAHAGYDLASGRGSMIINSVIADSATLGNKPPVGNFSYAATGLKVNFTDTSTDSDGTIILHSWTFGDGSTSAAADPSHTYAAAGTYSVRDLVKDNDGASGAKTRSIVVAP